MTCGGSVRSFRETTGSCRAFPPRPGIDGWNARRHQNICPPSRYDPLPAKAPATTLCIKRTHARAAALPTPPGLLHGERSAFVDSTKNANDDRLSRVVLWLSPTPSATSCHHLGCTAARYRLRQKLRLRSNIMVNAFCRIGCLSSNW